MPRQEQVRSVLTDRFQRAPLVTEKIQREACIEFRVVYTPPFELWVLIVLDDGGDRDSGERRGGSVSTCPRPATSADGDPISPRSDVADRRRSGYGRADSPRHRRICRVPSRPLPGFPFGKSTNGRYPGVPRRRRGCDRPFSRLRGRSKGSDVEDWNPYSPNLITI